MPPEPDNEVTPRRSERLRAMVSHWTALNTPVQANLAGPFLIGLWVAVMTVAQLFRQPGVASWNTVWQEDGSIFLSDAMYQSFPRALVHSYNAYLHVVPRILAAVAAVVPLERAALVLAASSALVVAVLSVYVYFASAALLRSEWARVLLAVMFVLLPATAYETTANLANLHWYLLFACFWAFLDRPQSLARVALATTVAVAAVLSDPMAGLFLPLAVLMIWTRTSRRDLVVPVAFFVALGLQLALGALATSPAPYTASHVVDLPGIYALRVAGSFLVGDRQLRSFWGQFRWWFAYASLAVVAGLAVFATVKAGVSTRFYLLVSIGYSCAFLAIPLMLRGTERFLDGPGFNLNGSRYMVVPLWFLVLATLLVLERPVGAGPGARWQKVQCAVVVYLLALVVVNFSDFSVRTAGPGWREQLSVARQECARGERFDPAPPGVGPEIVSRLRDYHHDVLIPIAPNIEPHPFVVPVTCARLR